MKLLTPGEKIKKLRLELGLKQEDIANNKVSKTLISMIENNSRALTLQTATIIAESLNKHYKVMGKEITPEYLMETEVEVIKKQVKEDIEYLRHLSKPDEIDEGFFIQSFEKVMEVVKGWRLNEEVISLSLIKGNYFYKTYNYNGAIREYSKVLTYFLEQNDYEQVVEIYNLIGACYYMLTLIDQAIIYYKKSFDTTMEHKTTNQFIFQVRTVFNLILCYRKLKQFDLALHYIGIFKEMEREDDTYKKHVEQVALLEANTYRDTMNIERAKKSYAKLLQEESRLSKDILFLLYDNYVIYLMEQGDTQEALEYINKALELRNCIKATYLPWILITKAKCYKKLSQHKEALAVLDEAIVLSEKISYNDQIADCHLTVMEIMRNEIEELLKEKVN